MDSWVSIGEEMTTRVSRRGGREINGGTKDQD